MASWDTRAFLENAVIVHLITLLVKHRVCAEHLIAITTVVRLADVCRFQELESVERTLTLRHGLLEHFECG